MRTYARSAARPRGVRARVRVARGGVLAVEPAPALPHERAELELGLEVEDGVAHPVRVEGLRLWAEEAGEVARDAVLRQLPQYKQRTNASKQASKQASERFLAPIRTPSSN